MRKYTVVFVLILCFGLFQVAFGQGPKFGVGGNLGFPTGDWSDFTGGVGFGGTVQVLFPMGENMAVGAQAGYMIFGGETIDVPGASVEWDFSAIPILAQGRYYLGVPGGPRPFVGALVGFHMFQVDVTQEITILGQTQTVSGDDNSTEFTIAPMGGIEVGNLDISAFYMIISDANYFGGRVGFNFGG